LLCAAEGPEGAKSHRGRALPLRGLGRIDGLRPYCRACHTAFVDLNGNVLRAVLVLFLSPVFFFAQDTKTTGTVAPNIVEFKIPLEQPADAIWNWNRAEIQDNECEYMWQVAVPGGSGRYTFGFYLYKVPGSTTARGALQDLFNAGQASVFKEDAEDRGDMIDDANVKVSSENGRVVIRLTDANLIRTIFGSHPATVTINTREIGSNFETVKIDYRN
jgi:hypothetical protein